MTFRRIPDGEIDDGGVFLYEKSILREPLDIENDVTRQSR